MVVMMWSFRHPHRPHSEIVTCTIRKISASPLMVCRLTMNPSGTSRLVRISQDAPCGGLRHCHLVPPETLWTAQTLSLQNGRQGGGCLYLTGPSNKRQTEIRLTALALGQKRCT